MSIRHDARTACYTITVGDVTRSSTYERGDGVSKREAWAFAVELEGELVAKAAAALEAPRGGYGYPDGADIDPDDGEDAPVDPNAEIAEAVAARRGGYEPDAEERAEVAAWLDELEAEAAYAATLPHMPTTTTTTPAQPGVFAPTLVQLDAALARRQAEAERALDAARLDGDAEGVKIARRSAQAYRDARVIAEDGGWRVAANGDLLVKSRSRNQWHVVARQPTNGDGWSPITCSCEWNQKAHAWGPCTHVAFFEGFFDATEAAVALLDDQAEYRRLVA
jgi:hypothetical protein